MVRAGQQQLGPWEAGALEGRGELREGHCVHCVAAVDNAARPSQSQSARQPVVTASHGRSICFCLCDAVQPCWLEALELVLQAGWHDR